MKKFTSLILFLLSLRINITLFFFTVFIIFSNNTIYSQQIDGFVTGFTGMYPNRYAYTVSSGVNWSWYTEQNVNMWQGWYIGDKEKEVLIKLDDYNINGYFMPDTLRWLGGGKVQVNEAEQTDANNQPVGRFRYKFYRCGQDIDDYTFGNGARVRYYNKNLNCSEQIPSGDILWGLNENGICSFARTTGDPVYESIFPYRVPDSPDYKEVEKWYIKPRMRIDRDVALYGPDLPVVKIIAISYDSSILKEVTITTKDFVKNNTYGGEYIQDYTIHNMDFYGDKITGINKGRTCHWLDVENHLYNNECAVDFKIYWYGQVDVWIDYVKIMDQPAENFKAVSGPS